MNSLTVIAENFNKNFVKFKTTLEGPTTQELEECNKNTNNNDDKMFAFPTNTTDIFNTVDNFKNNTAAGNDGVSAEVLKFSLLVSIFTLI